MNKQKKIIWAILIVILIVLVSIFIHRRMSSRSEYSVVYLSTAEVYVGKLQAFPQMELTDAYIYQVTKDATDPTKANFQLQPVKDMLWAPQSLYLEKENVIFYGPLSSDSKIAQTLTAQK